MQDSLALAVGSQWDPERCPGGAKAGRRSTSHRYRVPRFAGPMLLDRPNAQVREPQRGAYGYSTKEGAVLTTMSMIPFVETTMFKSHYAARLSGAGLDVARTEAAVRAALNSVRAGIAVMADVRGRMMVDGVLVEYGARVLPNGTLHVGTIFPVK